VTEAEARASQLRARMSFILSVAKVVPRNTVRMRSKRAMMREQERMTTCKPVLYIGRYLYLQD
jgi:hypothetical protein